MDDNKTDDIRVQLEDKKIERTKIISGTIITIVFILFAATMFAITLFKPGVISHKYLLEVLVVVGVGCCMISPS